VTVDEDHVNPRPERELSFRLLLLGLAAIGPFSLNIFKPCLPWIRADLDADIGTVQLGLSLAMVVAALATAVSGPVADTVGRRSLTIACVWLYVLSCVVAATAVNVEILVAARVVQAASSSVALVLARTLIYDGQSEVQQRIARVTFFAVAAVLLAPALGGVLIDHVGWRAVFVLTALLGVLLLWPVHTALPESSAARERSTMRETFGRVGQLVRSRVFAGYAGQSSLHFAIFFAFTSASSYIMVDVLGRSASEYGVWFVGVALVTGVGLAAAERLAKRVRAGRSALMGSALVMLGSIVSGVLLLSPELVPLSPAVLFLPGALAGFGIGLTLPGTNAGVMYVVPNLAATASGLLAFLQYIVGAAFAQWVVHDEPNTVAVLGTLILVGGCASFGFALLSAGHDVVREELTSPSRPRS
jgi:DHA1 family bicyclomycin/chloramphenicol resistance-like MFS transporter